MTVMTFEVRADLSQYLHELQKGEKALNAFVANAAMAPAALTRAFAGLAREGAAVPGVARAKFAIGRCFAPWLNAVLAF